MTEKKRAEIKEEFEDMLSKLNQGNLIAIMRNNQLIKAVEYDSDIARILDTMLKAVIRGLEK